MIQQHSRRTKVVKSFEGAALTQDEAAQVARQDVDVLRLVYEPKQMAQIQSFMKRVSSDASGPLRRKSIMIDLSSWTQGWVTGLKEPREVTFAEKVAFVPASAPIPSDAIGVRAEQFDSLFVADAKVYVGAGNVVLRTMSVRPGRVDLEVTQGGTIWPDMDIIVPDTRRDAQRPTVTEAELRTLVAEGADFLVVPGSWPLERIRSFRAQLATDYGDKAPWLMVKVDSGDVYERLPAMVDEVDGVLISRREMALTINPATVPMITKEIIQLCSDRAKVVLTASEMLASMRRNVTPTRAEVSDVANAVLDGTDAVMLSEEVANGRHGAKAVEVMARIITDIEERTAHVRPNWTKQVPTVTTEMDAIAFHALRTAERLGAKAIVTITKAGNTALKLASFRAPVPVIAVTFSEPVVRRLSMVRGVEPLLLDVKPNLDEVLPLVNDHLVRSSWLKAGDKIIFVAITLSPVGRESSNLFTVQTLT